MGQLWLIPVDDASFRATVADPIDLGAAPDKPDEFPDEARVWGVRTDPAQGEWKRNRRNLERMEEGDPLLIYRNGVGRYDAMGRIGPFWHTEYVRDRYWQGGSALDVFALDDYQPIELSTEAVNRQLGYKESFYPQGLWRVSDDRPVGALVRRLGL